jgi:purine-nucleoside phosphorylase
MDSASESTYAKFAWGIDEEIMYHQGKAFDVINETASSLAINAKATNIHTSDIFYRKIPGIPAVAEKYNCLAVEMEAFALFANAKHLGKNAATILTVSDIPTHEEISADERELLLEPMMN